LCNNQSVLISVMIPAALSVQPNFRRFHMNRKIGWLPSLLIIIGGLYTIFYSIQLFYETKELFEQSSGLLRAFSAVQFGLSGSLILPIIIGSIVAMIGAYSFWKPHVFLALISLIIVTLMLNWVGCILSITGAIMGIVIWRKQSVD